MLSSHLYHAVEIFNLLQEYGSKVIVYCEGIVVVSLNDPCECFAIPCRVSPFFLVTLVARAAPEKLTCTESIPLPISRIFFAEDGGIVVIPYIISLEAYVAIPMTEVLIFRRG